MNQYNILEFHTGFGLINSNLRKFSPGPDSRSAFCFVFWVTVTYDSHRLTNRFDTGVLKFEQVPGFGLQIAPREGGRYTATESGREVERTEASLTENGVRS